MANGASCMSTIRSRHWAELPNFPTHCGNNLSFLGTETPESLERVRFSALKLSAGRMNKLRDAVALANKDWRDLLVGAGVVESVDAHKHCKPA